MWPWHLANGCLITQLHVSGLLWGSVSCSRSFGRLTTCFVSEMMEVDHISYIFGSFSRRRQSHDVGLKRRSIEQPKINHDRSKSTPHSSKKVEIAAPKSRAKSVCNFILDESKYKCPMCQKHYIEPRVLPCLHTFCTRCLQELELNEIDTWNGSDGKTFSFLRFYRILFSLCLLYLSFWPIYHDPDYICIYFL